MTLKIETILVTPFQQNARVLYSNQNECLVIDPGGDVFKIMKFLEKERLACTMIWLTHSHLDHCGGVQELKVKTGAKIYASRLGSVMRTSVVTIKNLYGIGESDLENCPEPDVYLEDHSELIFSGIKFKLLFTPGHSPDHYCFYAEDLKLLLAGDTLFNSSIGRTDLPGGEHELLIKSIKEKLFTLPSDTRVLSGHGPDTIIRAEISSNPFLQNL